MTVNTTVGQDVVYVNGLPSGSSVNVVTATQGGGSDAVYIGGANTVLPSLSNVQGTVSFNGFFGGNVYFYDNAGPSNTTYQLSETSLSRPRAGTFQFTDIGSVTLYTSQGTDQVDVNGPNSFLWPTLNIVGALAATTTLQVNGALATNYTVTGGQMTMGPVGIADTITYSRLAKLELNLAATTSPNTVDVESTPAEASSTVIKDLAATAAVTVCQTSMNLDSIVTPLTVDGNGKIVLTVDDQNNPNLVLTNDTVTNNSLTRDAIDAFGHQHDASITYSGLGSLVLNTGSQINLVDVESTAVRTTINAGAGNALVTVSAQAENLDNLPGALTINGNGFEPVIVNDQNNPNLQAKYSLTGTALTVTGNFYIPNKMHTVALKESITYSGIGSLVLNTASLANQVTVQNTSVPTTINGGGGNNTYNVQATGATTAINTGSGNDSVDLGAANQLQGIQAPLTIVGQGGTDTMTANDQASTAAQTYSVNAGVLYVRPLSMGITYSGISTLVLNGSQGDSSYNIQSTAAGTAYQINAGRGDDSFYIAPFVQDCNAIVGGLTLKGAGGTNTLTVDDQSNPNAETYTITSTVLYVRPSSGITYSGFKTVVFNGSSGGSAIIVGSTAAGTSTTINGGAGYNEFVLGYPLDNLKGPTTLHAGGDPYSYVIFNDSEAAAGQTYTLTANTLTRSGIAPITWDTMNQVILYTGSGNDHVNVRAVAAATDESIAAATGDVVTVGSLAPALGGTVANILGELVVQSGIVSVIVDDSGDATPHPHAVFSAPAANPALYNLTGLAPAPIYFDLAPGSTGTVHGGSGGNTFTVANQPQGFNMNVDGGTGTNTLVGPNASNTWNVTGHNSGTLGSVSFAKMQNLVGGTGVDVFQFASAGSVSSINGGGAPPGQGDWLDYSALTTPVMVNLATGSATNVNGGVAGAVTNIQNVFGGSGGSTLIGDAQGNILLGGSGADTITGGTGRSLLIGDGSSGQITGGSASGGDILIGGTTSYDSDNSANITALMAILAEWQSADSYNTRFTDINTGTIPGGYSLNYGTTVNDDGAANVLTGAASGLALDWFFAGTLDTTINLVPGEHLNNT